MEGEKEEEEEEEKEGRKPREDTQASNSSARKTGFPRVPVSQIVKRFCLKNLCRAIEKDTKINLWPPIHTPPNTH